MVALTVTRPALVDNKPIATENMYVLAGTYWQARNFAISENIFSNKLMFVDSRRKIVGLRGKKLYIVGTGCLHENYHEIIEEALIREFDVIYV